MKKNDCFMLAAWITLVLILAGCAGRLDFMIKQLPPDHQDFLSKVRYIINKDEKITFLNLKTERERLDFIDEFWKKRDPAPETEENEFKTMYFDRIETASKLFKEAGTPGWITDRGRIYILLGPPDNRYMYPTGYQFYDFPSEVWIYNFFPIIFIDNSYSGTYRLTSDSAIHIAELNKGLQMFKPEITTKKIPFDFTLDLRKQPDGVLDINFIIPYERIVLTTDGSGNRNARLDIRVETKEITSGIKNTFKRSHVISLNEEDLKELKKNYVFKIPLELAPGHYEIAIGLKSNLSDEEISRKIRFKL